MDGLTKSNPNPDSDLAKRTCHKLSTVPSKMTASCNSWMGPKLGPHDLRSWRGYVPRVLQGGCTYVSGMSWRHDTGTLAVESYVRDARLWGDYRRKETEWRENGESVQCSLISPYFGCDKLYFWRKVPISYSCDD